ncbi:MAG: hypothetical protein Q9184_000141 [Pyrenodesmia sp. 2 TL-2023]
MTAILGKRKRREHIETSDRGLRLAKSVDDNQQLQQLLKQHFEARFEPLQADNLVWEEARASDKDTESGLSEEDWTGLSEDGGQADALVVDYQHFEGPRADVSKEELKLFMSTKPPIQPTVVSTNKQVTLEPAEDATTEAANLKKDLALQRLLEESHLLDPTSSLAPQGRNRHKALDIRQQALGSKSSMYQQKNMPLAQRKGIMAKSAERDTNRRRDAKENGVILEKLTKSKSREPKRQREIGAPTVGKFSRGMLTLSKKDLSNIVGRPKKSKRGRSRR